MIAHQGALRRRQGLALLAGTAVAVGGAMTWLAVWGGLPAGAADTTPATACLANHVMLVEVARDATEPRPGIPAPPVARCPATPAASPAPSPEPTSYDEPPPSATYTYPY